MTQRYRALVAEDTDKFRRLVTHALARHNIACDEAPNGVVATNLVDFHRYDVVIADLRMPRKHGHEFLVELLQRKYPAILIAMTGVVEPKVAADLIARGVDDVIAKPFDFDFFAAKIKALLDRKALRSRWDKDEAQIPGRIDVINTALKGQLDDITRNFQDTINRLEQQKDHIQSRYVETVRLLSDLVSGIGPADESHVRRVEQFAIDLAGRSGAPPEIEFDLRMACLFHEIGLLGLPDSVRGQLPADLDADDAEAYRKYPVLSATILGGIYGAERSAAMVEDHMENYDGSGFPAGKQGEEIAAGARIIRIADGLDTFAMQHDAQRNRERLLDHLEAESGKAYDPALAGHAATLLEDLLEFPERSVAALDKDDLAPGMVLAENLCSSRGQFLLKSGTVITEANLKRLQTTPLNNDTVAVYDD